MQGTWIRTLPRKHWMKYQLMHTCYVPQHLTRPKPFLEIKNINWAHEISNFLLHNHCNMPHNLNTARLLTPSVVFFTLAYTHGTVFSFIDGWVFSRENTHADQNECMASIKWAVIIQILTLVCYPDSSFFSNDVAGHFPKIRATVSVYFIGLLSH